MDMRMIKNILCLIIIIFFVGCRKDYTVEYNVIEENKKSMELYKKIEDCINNNRINLVGNTSKTLIHYGLWRDELDFQNKRLDYFIALLNNDEIIINEYYIIEDNFRLKIPLEARAFFYYTKEDIDFQLFHLLENNFDELKLPVNIIRKYLNRGIVKQLNNN
jgi:hypothetical protein